MFIHEHDNWTTFRWNTEEGSKTIISAKHRDGSTLRDTVSRTDAMRLADGEITLADLAYKHFAYLMG